MRSTISMVCLSILLILTTGCAKEAATPSFPSSSVSSGSSSDQSAVSALVGSSMADSESSQPSSSPRQSVTAFSQAVNMDRYGLVYRSDRAGTVYSIDGEIYLSLADASSLSKTAIAYDPTSGAITVGDRTKPNVNYYMPDLSAYPMLDNGNSLFNFHWKANGVTDFLFSDRNSSFQKMLTEAARKLQSDDFVPVTKTQYAELRKNLSEFGQGELKNTFLKSGNGKEPYAIQLIDNGGSSGITARMKTDPGYSAVNWMNNPSNVVIRPSKAAALQGSAAAAVKTGVTVRYYDLQAHTDAYAIGGKLYLSLDDVSRLFRTKIICDYANHSISFGDGMRARIEILFDLSEYPNLEEAIGSSPSEIWSENTIVTAFRFMAKNNSFQDTLKGIVKRLKEDGFTPATEEQFAKLPTTNYTNAFQPGGRKNTYTKNNRVKYSNGESSSETFLSVIQILDEGLGKNKLPTVTVKVLNGYYQ
ncbi:MAG TPA: hypothetical protein VHO71_03220 [Caproiciproducens sp.]|nr:hypothetical protein [Caproiciproducens sp.]